MRAPPRGVGIWHQPDSSFQSFCPNVTRQPLRPMWKFLLIPVFDPGMPLRSAVVAVIKFNIFEAIRQKMGCDPICVKGHVRFGDIFVVDGPARPDLGRASEMGVIKTGITR